MEDWRRIDVDQYDPDKQFVADDLGLPVHTQADIQPAIQQIRQAVGANSIVQAVQAFVANPPYNAAPDVKQTYLGTVLEALTAARQSEVARILQQLTIDEVDVLVKFIYALMATTEGQKAGGVLLGWLDKTVDAVGEGPIVRYMSDPVKM